MSDDSFQQDVLNELGDDRLTEIAGLLGTDAAGATTVVDSSVSELSGGLREAAATPDQAEEVRQAVAEVSEPPLEGVATLGGGLLGGGLMASVLSRLARPAATAVAKRTGLPVATVSRVLELLIPVVVTVLTKRAARGRSGGAASGGTPATRGGAPGAAPSPGASGSGMGEVLGGLLGGEPKKH
ncbi:DUF937 domain-containing protein [Streptomyces sp. FIT100]|uniref:DUF937 domain-containing protein n=1 Tax=Streptomyces sp. FIT100 TaxID=2837956 RepID=UPI0021C621F5|nr:DUF937 domain-containing protein [Streptomyces sp. FIT100]UUN26995.1 DUF937 domain-containing protein [Streptomyces sp. FIT100]